MKERRAEPRLLCSDLIQVRLEGDEVMELTGNLEDISSSGACIQFERPVEPGTRVCLKLGRYRFHARVSHCTLNAIGWFVGVQFEAGRKWTQAIYKPKHLIDPNRITVGSSKSNA